MFGSFFDGEVLWGFECVKNFFNFIGGVMFLDDSGDNFGELVETTDKTSVDKDDRDSLVVADEWF